MTWQEIFSKLVSGTRLTTAEADWVMTRIMLGEASPAQIGALMTALRPEHASVEEVIGFRDAILAQARPVQLPSRGLDIVGTGGDRAGTINVSTMSAIVCAAAGIPVIKHGNRAASSLSGSTDVLGELGIAITDDAAQLGRSLEEAGIAFIHAAAFLPGFRHVAAARKELGVATIFNFLGPLCNPARPDSQAIGVADERLLPLFAGVFQRRGTNALVFRGDDGLDELTTTGHSRLWEVSGGKVAEHDIDPRELGIELATIEDLRGASPAHNAEVVRRVLAGEKGPARDIVLLNSAAGMVAFDLLEQPQSMETPLLARMSQKMRIAGQMLDSGQAARKLAAWAGSSSGS